MTYHQTLTFHKNHAGFQVFIDFFKSPPLPSGRPCVIILRKYQQNRDDVLIQAYATNEDLMHLDWMKRFETIPTLENIYHFESIIRAVGE